MGLKRKDKFRKDAVRIALTSGVTRRQVADDLGVDMSTLTAAPSVATCAPQTCKCPKTTGSAGRNSTSPLPSGSAVRLGGP